MSEDRMEVDAAPLTTSDEAPQPVEPQEQNETPREVPYSAQFTDSIIHPVLNPPPRAKKGVNGIRVLHQHSRDIPKTTTVRFDEIDHASLPTVDPSELPLPIDDVRRIYASGVAGIRLTHPGGPLEGGPPAQPYTSPDQEQPEFVKQFMDEHGINTAAQLLKAVKAEQATHAEELRKRMREREEANEKNRKVQEKIDNLVAERDMERRVHESARRNRDQD